MKHFSTCSIMALVIMLFSFNAKSQYFEAGDFKKINPADEKQTSDVPSGEDVQLTSQDIERFIQNISNRIVGGEDADILDYPWQISLQIRPPYGSSHFCGGTILNDEWILTASHCLVDDDFVFEPQHIRIRAGFTAMNSTQGSYYNVAEIITHPDYLPSGHQYDIALLRLSDPIDFENPATASVDIIRSKDVEDGLTDGGKQAKVSGWGALHSGGPSPNILQAVTVPIVEGSASYPPSWITADMILAGAAGLDACQGDSGGPMVVDDGSGWYKVAGVVSWGNGCGLAGYPGVYARVSYFENWLDQYIVSPDPNQFTNVWFEGFEPALANGQLPEGWEIKRNTQQDGGLNGNNLQPVTSTIPSKWFRLSSLNYPYNQGNAAQYIKSGSASMHISWNAPDFTWAITPEITLPAESENLELSFWPWINSLPADGWITQFYVTIFSEGQWHTLLDLDGAVNMFSSSVEASLENYLGQTIKLGFVHKWNDGIQLSVDDISIRSQNPPLQVEFQVTDGQQALSDAVITTGYTGQEATTNQDGEAFLTLYEGEYQITATRAGFFNYSQDITITHDGQVINIEMEKIPAPEIAVTPQSIEIDIYQGSVDVSQINISNPGDADLEYSIFATPGADSKSPYSNSSRGPAIYQGYETSDTFQAAAIEAAKTEQPLQRPDGQVELHYDSGPSTGIGTGSAVSFVTAVRFTSEELSQYYGRYELTAVKFHVSTNDFSNVTVKVWEGGSENGPGEEIYSENVTSSVTANSFTTHELAEPIALASGMEYWIGYSMAATGGHPATADAGPMEPAKGGWMFINNSWQTLPDLGLDRNWVIRGLLDPVIGVEWLTFDPAEGTVEPEQTHEVEAVINTLNLEVGQYLADIVINNNAGESIVIPLTLNVLEPIFDVSFILNDPAGNPVQDAIITLDGITNTAGDYQFEDLTEGAYQYQISKEGYLDAQGTIMVVNEDLIVTVTLIPDDATVYTLSVNVEDEFGDPVEGAYLSVEDFGSYLSDDQGEIEITMIEGNFSYLITKYGFEPIAGTFEINDNTDLLIVMNYLRYNIQVISSPDDGGNVTGDGEHYHGQTVSLEAVAANLYHFVHWTEGDEVLSEDPLLSFEAYSNRQLVAHFAPDRFSVSFQVQNNDQQPITNAIIKLNGQANPAGNYVFDDLLPGTYSYEVTRSGYFPASGNVTIVDSNVSHVVTLDVDDTSVTDPSVANIKVFPVPVINYLSVEAPEMITLIQVVDISGRVLINETPMSENTRISMNDLRPGIYFVRITSQNNTITRQIQKQ